jgi:hypothetical protein
VVQVPGLVTSRTAEAKDLMVCDEPGEIRARVEKQEFSSCLTYSNRSGKECLKIGLRTDSRPSGRRKANIFWNP